MYDFVAREKGLQQARARERGEAMDVTPHNFLDCTMLLDNIKVLNPGPLDIILRYIHEDSKGEGAKVPLSKRRISMVDGNISSYCTVLNGPDQLCLVG
eukprot:11584883-Ditylum_brightwellii.AAC.1